MTMLQFDLRKTSAPRGWVIACPDGCNNHEAGCPPALGACAPCAPAPKKEAGVSVSRASEDVKKGLERALAAKKGGARYARVSVNDDDGGEDGTAAVPSASSSFLSLIHISEPTRPY